MSSKRKRHLQDESTSEGMEDLSLLHEQESSESPPMVNSKDIQLDERIDSILDGIHRLKTNVDGAIKELEWLIRDMMESQADRRKTPPTEPKDDSDPSQ